MIEKYDLSNIEVLIVDHNQHMLGIIRTVLVELGVHRVRETAKPESAYALFRDHVPDIIFSDWIPGSEEMTFLNLVRTSKDSPNPFVPIIVITAYSEQANVLAARDLGMTDFIAAPVSAKTIYEHLCNVIQDKRPFIKEEHYFGPDRRRHVDEAYNGPERRSKVESVEGEAPAEEEAVEPDTKILDS